MSVETFVKEKSSQLSRYIHSYWEGDIVFNELQKFTWDTLEEWTLEPGKHTVNYSTQERLFWHILYFVQFQTEKSLKPSSLVAEELEFLLYFLDSNEPCPLDIIGHRP